MTGLFDLDGTPRIVHGKVDMGAYEFPGFPPVADASASRSLYISANGANATAVLDGSRSSYPDGDPLQYSWFLVAQVPTPGSTPLGTGIVAVVQLPIGTHLIRLAVSDGVASSTEDITVEVITTDMAVQHLIAHVEAGWKRSQPLTATMTAAQREPLRNTPDLPASGFGAARR